MYAKPVLHKLKYYASFPSHMLRNYILFCCCLACLSNCKCKNTFYTLLSVKSARHRKENTHVLLYRHSICFNFSHDSWHVVMPLWSFVVIETDCWYLPQIHEQFHYTYLYSKSLSDETSATCNMLHFDCEALL